MRRLYSWLIHAYPPEFRAQYGAEVLRSLDDGLAEAKGTRRVWFVLIATWDILRTAGQERFGVMRRNVAESCRRFWANPIIALVALVSLSIGIGANSTVFSIINASLLRPVPYRGAERIVMVHSTNGDRSTGVAPGDFRDYRERSRTLEDWHMFTAPRPMMALGGELSERVSIQQVTEGLFESLGFQPVIGRLSQPAEAGLYAVLSERYWRRAFGGKDDALGKTVGLEGGPHTIVGVVPEEFELFSGERAPTDIYGLIAIRGDSWAQRRIPWTLVMSRLKPGETMEGAQAEMSVIAGRLAKEYPKTNSNRGVRVMSFRESHDGHLRKLFLMSFGAAGLILLIGCANVANLLLAMATARRRELAVRAALGASRRRLAVELLCDGLVLSIPGVVSGVLLAIGGIHLYRIFAPGVGLPVAHLKLDQGVLAFAALAGVVAGVGASLFPAASASRTDLTEALKEGARGSSGCNRQRVRSLLVVGQIALALILLVAAGLTINTAIRLHNRPLGFDPNEVTVASVHMPEARYAVRAPTRETGMWYIESRAASFLEHMLREVSELPGVQSAALAAGVPMGPNSSPPVQVRALRDPNAAPRTATFTPVTGGYFETLRIPLLRGRYISEKDTTAGQWIAVVNQRFVRTFFPDQDAIGEEIVLNTGPNEPPRRIVGIVSDVTQFAAQSLTRPQVFTPYWQQLREVGGSFLAARLRPQLLVRSAVHGRPEGTTLTRLAAGFDKELAVYGVKPLDTYVDEGGLGHRFTATLWGVFSALALILAMAGIYGLMNYAVRDREHEIGIRLTLGASRGQVLRMILLGGLKLTVVGLAIGTAGALWTSKLFKTVLFEIEPWDPSTFAASAAALLVASISACLYPALRATWINCIQALRDE